MDIKAPYRLLNRFDENTSLVYNEATNELCLIRIRKTFERGVYESLKLINNIHIPRIYDVVEEDGKLYVTEEYVKGNTLRDLIRMNTMNREERLHIIKELCEGLDYLHRMNPPLIHRDLKPENIMVTTEGVVKIVDFDVAKIFKSGESRDTTLLGTFEYAAPEQYGFMQSDPRTDIYALGKIITELMPNDRTAAKIAAKACQIDPNNRYQSARKLWRAFETRGMGLWPPPGYRRLKVGPAILASLYYSFVIFIFLFISNGEDWVWWKHILYRFEMLFLWLPPVDIFFNWTGIWEKFPLRRRNKFLYYLIGILLFVTFFVMVRFFNETFIPYD